MLKCTSHQFIKFYSICSVSLWQPLLFWQSFKVWSVNIFLRLQSHFLPSGYQQQVCPGSHNVISKDGESRTQAGIQAASFPTKKTITWLVFVCYASSSKVFDSPLSLLQHYRQCWSCQEGRPNRAAMIHSPRPGVGDFKTDKIKVASNTTFNFIVLSTTSLLLCCGILCF